MKKVRLLGVINVSPESFYKGSVPKNERGLGKMAAQLAKAGADMIDVGAMSTAPYLKTKISEAEETRRLVWAVNVIRQHTRCPISIDTSRYQPALAGLMAGASYLNDITGLSEPRILKIAKQFKGLILMAHPSALKKPLPPILKVKTILAAAIKKAVRNGVPRSKIIIDPGIGFFRSEKMTWWEWDLELIENLKQLHRLKCPVLVGVSRKSFIGNLMGGAPAEERLEGSLLVTRIAVDNGATWVRTHDVKETKNYFLNLKRK